MTRRATMTALLFAILPTVPESRAQAPTAKLLDFHGDALPDNAVARLGTVRFRHGSTAVDQVVYLDAGKRLASHSFDGTVRVWDAQSGQEVRQLDASNVTAIAGDRDGKYLATVTSEGAINIWDVVGGKSIKGWRDDANQGCTLIQFSPNGKQLLSRGNDSSLHLWDLATGKRLQRFRLGDPEESGAEPNPSIGVAFLDNGKYVATGTTEEKNFRVTASLRRWDTTTGKEQPMVAGPASDFHALAFSADGKTAAWACDDGTLRLWDVTTNKQLHEIESVSSVSGTMLAFAPDGTRLASRDHNASVQLWDVASGRELRQLSAPHASDGGRLVPGSNLCFAPDGKWLASGTAAGTIRQWETDSGKDRGTIAGHHGAVFTLAIAADGKSVATHGGDGTLRLWDATTGKPGNVLALPDEVSQSALSADGRFVAYGEYDGILHFCDAATGKELRQWETHTRLSGFTALALSPDGKVAATRGADPAITLWDTATGKPLHLIRESVPGPDGVSPFVTNTARGTNLLFSPDGSLLAVRGVHRNQADLRIRRRRIEAPRDNTIRLWDVKSGQPLRPLETGLMSIQAFAFSPDSRTLAASTPDNFVTLWEPASGKMRWRFGRNGGSGALTALAWSPDGRMIAGVGQDFPESPIRFWNAATGQQLGQTFSGHHGLIACLAFTPDGRRLVSGGFDTTALVWHVAGVRPQEVNAEVTDQEAESLWNDLASPEALKAYGAIHALSLSPKRSVALLKEHLKPVPAVDEDRIVQLVGDLDGNIFAERHRATLELEKLGDIAEPFLADALPRRASVETRQRIERLLEKLALSEVPADVLRAQRALEVLERIGTPEARELLRSLSRGAAGARFTRGARAALERLGK